MGDNTHEDIATAPFAWQAWRAAFACAVGTMLSFVPIVTLTFPMFLKPISTEFGWGRATLSGVLLVAGLAGAAFGPLAGWAIDRWGARTVVLPGCIAFALTVMALSQVGDSPAMLYVIFVLIGIVQVSAGQIAYNKVVAAWFTRRRGLALGIAIGAAMSIGNGAAPQVARVLIAAYGWRHAYLLLGLIALIAFPVMWAWLREPPSRSPPEAAVSKRESRARSSGAATREAIRSGNFWLIMVIVLLFWIAVNGFRVHVVALLTDQGRSNVLAGTVLSMWSLGAFFGHIVIGHALDRVDTPRISIPFFACTLLGLLLITHTASPYAILTGAVLLGLGMGAEVTLAPYFITRFFGLHVTARIYAYVTICTSIGGSLGPYFMGLTYDSLGSYEVGLNVAAMALAACAVLTFFLSPYVYPASGSRLVRSSDT